MEPIIISEKEYLNLFKISLFIKGLNAILEVLGGILVWFTTKAFLVTTLLSLLQHELSDDPKDFVAAFIVNSAEALAVNSQYLFASYLFLHGFIKVFLIICLFKKKLWAYPVSIAVFSLLIVYQSYEYYLSQSIWILAFTLLDVLIVLLAIHEYGVLKAQMKNK